jgi:branched-subunit amino acid transport protein AzlD
MDYVISILLGIASNVATEMLHRALPPRTVRPPDASQPDRLLSWSLPSTLLAIGTLFLAQYRWVVPPYGIAALVAGTMLGSILSLWALRHFLSGIHWFVYVALCLVAFVVADRALPRFIAIDCPHAFDGHIVTLSGRVLDPSARVEIEYGPRGRDHHTSKAQEADADGNWHATVNLEGVAPPDESFRFVAVTSEGIRSRECTFGPRPTRTALR